MTGKNDVIVVAATNMFARYGYAKTTMGDIAAEAGVARQTVYNAFPGKEEILRAVVRHAGEKTFAAVTDAWKSAGTTAEKLAAFHDLGPLSWFEVIRAAPDWAELMDGVHKAASEEMTALDQKWRAALTDILCPDAAQDDAVPTRPHDVVDFFYSTSMNAKHGAQDIDHLRSRLATIRAATLSLLNA